MISTLKTVASRSWNITRLSNMDSIAAPCKRFLTPKPKDNFLHNTSRYTPHFVWLTLNQNPNKKRKEKPLTRTAHLTRNAQELKVNHLEHSKKHLLLIYLPKHQRPQSIILLEDSHRLKRKKPKCMQSLHLPKFRRRRTTIFQFCDIGRY